MKHSKTKVFLYFAFLITVLTVFSSALYAQAEEPPYFYNRSINPISHTIGEIITSDCEVVMTFENDEDLLVMARLEKDGERLERSLCFVQPTEEGCLVKSSFPEEGTYDLILFSRLKSESGSRFGGALKYTIIKNKPCDEAITYNKYLSGDDYIIDHEIGELATDIIDYDYTLLDEHVLNTPPEAEESVESLTQYLIEPCKNDLEKTRVIFRWIAENIAYDTESYFSGNYQDITSVPYVFKYRKSVCSGYANLFKKMSDLAGLTASVVNGFAKGYGYAYNPNVAFDTNHAWNAVLLDGKWRLLDATWAAGHLRGTSFNKEYNEFYFLPRAEDFLWNHYPEDQRWQLVSEPLSFEEYLELPDLKGGAFMYRVFPVSHLSPKIVVRDSVVVEIEAPPNIDILENLQQDGTTDHSATHLLKTESNKKTYVIYPPKTGTYDLLFFAKPAGTGFDAYESAISYELEVLSVKPKRNEVIRKKQSSRKQRAGNAVK